ncbi:hypothetical protein NDU88_006479 [Pleurodeles waltl]|uniref:Secreted protein n=1 Tax=Pleurodeles waltl TaxID=8319 RepID=A0AAV7X0S8_PLEWA|nr:hypothetical protein NDU88_006479 [Pleurodeles waltl]
MERLLFSLCAGAAGAGGCPGAVRLCWSAAAAEGRLSRLRVRSGRTQRKLGVPIDLPGRCGDFSSGDCSLST